MMASLQEIAHSLVSIPESERISCPMKTREICQSTGCFYSEVDENNKPLSSPSVPRCGYPRVKYFLQNCDNGSYRLTTYIKPWDWQVSHLHFILMQNWSYLHFYLPLKWYYNLCIRCFYPTHSYTLTSSSNIGNTTDFSLVPTHGNVSSDPLMEVSAYLDDSDPNSLLLSVCWRTGFIVIFIFFSKWF